MSPPCLLTLNDGIIADLSRALRFRPKERRLLPFLIDARPVSCEPIRTRFEGAARANARQDAASPGGTVGRVERTALRFAAVLAVATVIYCGWGAQHIAYNRQMAQLGQRLRETEQELGAVSRAFHALESQVALRAAQDLRPPEAVGLTVTKVRARARR